MLLLSYVQYVLLIAAAVITHTPPPYPFLALPPTQTDQMNVALLLNSIQSGFFFSHLVTDICFHAAIKVSI